MVRQPKKNTDIPDLQDIVSDAAPSQEEPDAPEKEEPVQQAVPAEPEPVRTGKSPRKRRSVVNRLISLRMVIVFFAFMLLLAVLLIVLPRPSASSIERRALASWPEFSVSSYFSGEFTGGITLAYDDTVPARDTFKNISNNIKSAFGISAANNVEVIGAVSRKNDAPSKDPTEQTLPDQEPGPSVQAPQDVQEETDEAAPAPENHSKNYHTEVVDTVNENGIIVAFQDGHWRAMSLYEYYFNSLYNDTVNYVRQVVNEEVNVYFMPIPLAVQFYCPPDYMAYTMDLEQVYKEVASHMISGVRCIDVIGALNAHNKEAIYLRTDHHWSPLGAYYTAKAFAEAVNVPFADLSAYTRYVNEGYVGTMYAFTESASILNDPEDFVYYVPTNSYTVDYYDTAFHYTYSGGLFADVDIDNSYSTFLGGDQLIAKVTTDTANGRRLVVIKDSYGNALIPFLTSSFEEIYVVDQRYFDINLVNFIAYNNITDVLFAHNYFCLAGPEAELLEYITYSNYDEEIYDDAPAAVLPER